tara:strand:- start:57 stop:446 length:390 start_codon:yes stop_codon:yes gene_type:complete
MTDLNANELFEKNKKFNEKVFNTFKEILKKCNTLIKFANQKKQSDIIFDVPKILLGYPSYDYDECLCYLILKLRNNNFFVKYIYPTQLYISWHDKSQLEKLKKEKKFIYNESQKEIPLDEMFESYKLKK